MKDVVLIQAASSTTKKKYQKKYKCPYCDDRFERSKLHIHIQNKHEEMIPDGWTALRVAFNTINNKTCGHCIICKEETDWNENKGRYERLCNKQECHDAYKKLVAERNKNKYGTERLQTDPRYAEEVQRKALAGRKGAGKYKFEDGGEVEYLGTYEKKLLEFLDKVMRCKSEDIIAPGPSIEYQFENKTHLYIPDFYYTPYNLLIEVKDGEDNPNKNPSMQKYKTVQQAAKEKAVEMTQKYNYIRLTNNDFGQLMSIMAVLKYNMMNDCNDIVMRVNEANIMEDMSGTIAAALPPLSIPSPIPYESDKDNYYAVVHKDKDHDEYGITKDPLQFTIYGTSNEAPGKYKVYKTDKNKIDKSYITFKIKDKQRAKDLYEQLVESYKSNLPLSSEYDTDNYIYTYLTNGSTIVSEQQILFDSRFELVRDYISQLKEDCHRLYNHLLHPKTIDILGEQVNELEELIK